MRRHSKFFGIKLLNRFALITFLGCISLFSVGFSSWAFVKQTTMGEDVPISVATLSSALISVKSIDTFDYGPDGIIEDDTIVSKGHFIVSLNLKSNDISSLYIKNDNTIIISTYLGCSKTNFLNSYVTGLSCSETGAVVGNNTSSLDESVCYTSDIVFPKKRKI
jgi:hypothetical protein